MEIYYLKTDPEKGRANPFRESLGGRGAGEGSTYNYVPFVRFAAFKDIGDRITRSRRPRRKCFPARREDAGRICRQAAPGEIGNRPHYGTGAVISHRRGVTKIFVDNDGSLRHHGCVTTPLYDSPLPSMRVLWPSCGDGWQPGLSVLVREVSMHAWGLRLRRVGCALASSRATVLPSGLRDTVGALDSLFRSSSTSGIPSLHMPLSNASSAASRLPSPGSGSERFATTFSV